VIPSTIRPRAERVDSTWVWEMHLSDHDLKQFDEERVRSLTAESLCILLVKLLADLKEARDRLNQSPESSSRSPSSRAPWEKASAEETSEDEPADVEVAVERERKREAQAKDPPLDEQDTKGVERKGSEPAQKLVGCNKARIPPLANDAVPMSPRPTRAPQPLHHFSRAPCR
jgi:hypothetical protein